MQLPCEVVKVACSGPFKERRCLGWPSLKAWTDVLLSQHALVLLIQSGLWGLGGLLNFIPEAMGIR